MYSIVSTAIIRGIRSLPVQVEADVSDGLPMFEMVGFLASEVKEARERVRTALRNSGHMLPAKRITVNLSPANVKKTGSGFDLPVAIAILAALGIIPDRQLGTMLVVGEIGLNGKVQPVEGILPVVADANGHGFTHCLVPYGNRREAQMIKNIQIITVKSIRQAIEYFNGQYIGMPDDTDGQETRQAGDFRKAPVQSAPALDFSQVNGQRLLRRACEVAAAGMHNLLVVGPPGAGKTMAAQRIPTILPPMCKEEQLELAKIYSISGKLNGFQPISRRPFRNPHHTITPQGLVGGGISPKPGEISLAHKGVLFLDELTEFPKSTLELLRQPMEDRQISLSRLNGNCSYPSDFMLVAAMNPCPCGAYPDMNRCRCTQGAISRYLGRVSQPLLDRIDICIEASKLTYAELGASAANESSKAIRERVCGAWEIQKRRHEGSGIYFNSQIPAGKIKEECRLSGKEEKYLQDMYKQAGLTARAYYKILCVARTIADLGCCGRVTCAHLSEAFCYRSLDKDYWER